MVVLFLQAISYFFLNAAKQIPAMPVPSKSREEGSGTVEMFGLKLNL